MEKIPQRKTLRLQDYDYSRQGMYYITICIKNREQILSKIINKKIPFLISTLKRLVNKQIGDSIWQRNYYEHTIRNEKEYLKIKKYILENPIRWLNKN